MAVLGGLDDDVWFGLQNAQQTAAHHLHQFNPLNNHHHGFANQNMINNTMGLITNNCVNNLNTNQEVLLDNHEAFPSSSSSSNRFLRTDNLESQLELHRQELDCILHFQNEKLRIALHEQRKQQMSSLVKSLDAKATSLMKQKDDDLARATRKAIELQELVRKLETESQAWQRIARANEATIMGLNNALEQALRERQGLVGNDNVNENDINNNNINRAEDAESSCFGSCEELLNGMMMSRNHNQKWVCKSCNARRSSVVFLPCKHLCSCKACEALLGSCPVCQSTKEASLEVFLV